MPIVIINTPEEAEEFCRRLFDEPERVKNETGKGPGAMRFSPAAIMRAIEDGDVIAIGRTNGVEPHRVAVWLHHEPGQGIWINHLWAPSLRYRGVTRWVAQKLVDRGFGMMFGHFANIDMPQIHAMKAIVLPQIGDYDGANNWTNDPNGRTCRVRLIIGLNRLIAAGAPVEQ